MPNCIGAWALRGGRSAWVGDQHCQRKGAAQSHYLTRRKPLTQRAASLQLGQSLYASSCNRYCVRTLKLRSKSGRLDLSEVTHPPSESNSRFARPSPRQTLAPHGWVPLPYGWPRATVKRAFRLARPSSAPWSQAP